MKIRPGQFAQLDLAGAALYVFAYGGFGFLFRDFLAAIARGFRTAGHAMETVLLITLAGYVVYRVWLYRKHAIYRVVPRVQVEELASKLTSGEKDKLLIVHVRRHGYYEAYAARIQGSVRLEPNNLTEELKKLPKDKDIYLYCT
jgi:hypothetical protein